MAMIPMASEASFDKQLLDELKREAASTAVELVRSDSVIGLGTGSTSAHFLRLLGQRIHDGRLRNVVGVPTSEGAGELAREFGIPLTHLDEYPELEITVDGADEVDPTLNMIKGGGGALLREKIVAQVTRRLVIIVDESKLSERLGTNWPVPVEVIPFGSNTQRDFLEGLGADVEVRSDASGKSVHTDQGNLIMDCRFGPIEDAYALAHALDQRAGIVEHGLFLDMADEVIVAGKNGTRRLSRDD
jgi:ribose 5-phosphate isomerase A